MLQLEMMTEPEFAAYLEFAIDDYAQTHIKAGDCEPSEAHALAKADYEALLPKGLASEGQHLFTVRDSESGSAVGMIWFELRERKNRKSAFIYDFSIRPEHRRKGYGEQTLQLAEALAASMGAGHLGLNVMGYNHAARALYEKAGYRITGMGMRKALE